MSKNLKKIYYLFKYFLLNIYYQTKYYLYKELFFKKNLEKIRLFFFPQIVIFFKGADIVLL